MRCSLSVLGLSLLFHISILGQENQRLDSLISVYNSLSDSIEKIALSEKILEESLEARQDTSLFFIKESIRLSKQLRYRPGTAKAFFNSGKHYSNLRNLDSASFYFKKASLTFNELKDYENQVNALLEWIYLENIEGRFEKAIRLSDEAISIAMKFEKGDLISDVYQQKSSIYVDKGNYQKAVENLLLALRSIDTIIPRNPLKEAMLKARYGRIELLRENYDEALQPLSESLETFKNEKNNKWQANVYMELGSLFFFLKDYDKSLENYQNSLEVSYIMNRDDYVAANLGNIGAVFMQQKEYDRALEYFFKSIGTAKKRGSVNNEIIGYNDITNAYQGKKDFQKALEYNAKSIHIADSVGSLVYLRDAYRNRSRILEKMGLFQRALKNRKKYEKLNDSIFNTSKFRQIEELKTEYETEKKEQQIALQEKEITVLEQKAEISTLQKILLGALLVLSLIGFYGVRQKMKRNKIEKEKVDAELAFKRKELTTHALHLAKKNEVLEGLKQKAQELKEKETSKNGYQQLIRTINFDLQDDNNWENFSRYFEEVHKDFNRNVKSKYPQVTSNELRLLALLKMNLSSKEIANILNISSEGIKKARYRLRKKLDIATEDSLQDLVLSL